MWEHRKHDLWSTKLILLHLRANMKEMDRRSVWCWQHWGVGMDIALSTSCRLWIALILLSESLWVDKTEDWREKNGPSERMSIRNCEKQELINKRTDRRKEMEHKMRQQSVKKGLGWCSENGSHDESDVTCDVMFDRQRPVEFHLEKQYFILRV